MIVALSFLRIRDVDQRADDLNEEKLWVEGPWRNQENWTIACGSEIKDDAELWRHLQISPANFETE